MKNYQRYFIACLLMVCATVAYAKPQLVPEFAGGIHVEIIWNSSDAAFSELNKKCRTMNNPTDYGQCILENMQRLGASEQALAFNQWTRGWVKKITQYETIYALYAMIPGADYSDGLFFVNTKGEMINVDDWDLLKQIDLKKAPNYQSMIKKYPKMMLWQSDRNIARVAMLANQGQRFIINYRLADGCNACATAGIAKIAFDFDQAGNFIGNKLITLVPK